MLFATAIYPQAGRLPTLPDRQTEARVKRRYVSLMILLG
jgi:hypothetical protein